MEKDNNENLEEEIIGDLEPEEVDAQEVERPIDDDEIKFDDDETDETPVLDKNEEKYEEKYKRLLAEFDNYKKRTAKEALQAKGNGKIEVFTGLIDIIDTLDKAIEQVEDDDDFTKGIKMTSQKLHRNMDELGLKEVTYETFDPNYHMAVVTDNIEDMDDDEIIEVLQKGYQYDGKLIRQAMVKVNKK